MALCVSCPCAGADEGTLYGMLPGEPESSAVPRVCLQGSRLRDCQTSSRTPWFSSQGLPAPLVGLSTIGPHPGRRREMITVSKGMDLEVNFSWLKAESGVHWECSPSSQGHSSSSHRALPTPASTLELPMENPQTQDSCT